MKVILDPKSKHWHVVTSIQKEKANVRKIEAFLHTFLLRRLSPCSIRSYAYDLVVIHNWFKQDRLSIEKLKGKHQFRLIAFENKKKRLPASINRRLVILRVYFRFCTGKNLERVGRRITLPAGHYRGSGKDFLGLVSRPRRSRTQLSIKLEKKLVIPLVNTEVNLFLREITNYRDLAMVALMLLCGLRSSEVRTLELSSLELDLRQLRVRGKGAKERLMPLSETVIRLIQNYLKWERPAETDSSALFLISKGHTRGERLTASGFRSLFRYRRKISGVAHANPHRFRHSFGTNLARAGMNLFAMQKLLGHEPGSPVTQRYLHLAIGDIADAFYAVNHTLEKQYADFK